MMITIDFIVTTTAKKDGHSVCNYYLEDIVTISFLWWITKYGVENSISIWCVTIIERV